MYAPAVRIAGKSCLSSAVLSFVYSRCFAGTASSVEPEKSVNTSRTVVPWGGRTATFHGWSGPNQPLAGKRTERNTRAVVGVIVNRFSGRVERLSIRDGGRARKGEHSRPHP